MITSSKVTTPVPLKHHSFGSRIPLDSSAKENPSLERRGPSFLLILVISMVTFSSPVVQLKKPAKAVFVLTFTSLKANFKVCTGSLSSDYRPLRGQTDVFLPFGSALFSYKSIQKECTFLLSLEILIILVMCFTARSAFTASLTSWQLLLKIHPVVKALSPAAN